MSLTDHLEATLGPILHGWTLDASAKSVQFQVVQFREVEDTSFFSTLGLSSSSLVSDRSGRKMRCELIMLAKVKDPVPSILQQVGREILKAGRMPLRGEVIGLPGSLTLNAELTGLYVSAPGCLPDSFAVCQDDRLGEIVLIWLIPITSAEAGFVQREGWDAFETVLEAQDADLSDFRRASVVVSGQSSWTAPSS